jgi:acyl carrier protein
MVSASIRNGHDHRRTRAQRQTAFTGGKPNNYNAGITRQSTSADVPGWDSLTHVVFILSLEEMTGVSLSPRATSELADLGALYDLVSQSQTSAG